MCTENLRLAGTVKITSGYIYIGLIDTAMGKWKQAKKTQIIKGHYLRRHTNNKKLKKNKI